MGKKLLFKNICLVCLIGEGVAAVTDAAEKLCIERQIWKKLSHRS